jgi:YesN/AraC family two-component response regulator
MGNDEIINIFPLKLYSCFQPKASYWESEYYQIIQFGSANISLSIAGRPYNSNVSQIILVHPKQQLKLSDGLKNMRIFEFQSPLLDLLFKQNKPLFTQSVPLNKTIQGLLNKIWKGQSSGSILSVDIRLASCMFSVLSEFLIMLHQIKTNDTQLVKSTTQRGDGRYIVYATRFIKKEMSNSDLSLEDIAKSIGYHPNYFCQEFKRVMDISPFKYVNRLRIQKALLLLKTTNDNIKTICTKTGIKKPTTLCALVKRKVGMTPMEFRRKFIYENNSI